MTPAEREQLRAIADRVRRIRAYCHRRPHVFVEDKSEVAGDLDRLAGPYAAPKVPTKPSFEATFGKSLRRTVTVSRGRDVVVERRGRPS